MFKLLDGTCHICVWADWTCLGNFPGCVFPPNAESVGMCLWQRKCPEAELPLALKEFECHLLEAYRPYKGCPCFSPRHSAMGLV